MKGKTFIIVYYLNAYPCSLYIYFCLLQLGKVEVCTVDGGIVVSLVIQVVSFFLRKSNLFCLYTIVFCFEQKTIARLIFFVMQNLRTKEFAGNMTTYLIDLLHTGPEILFIISYINMLIGLICAGC